MQPSPLLDKARRLTALAQEESYAWIAPDKLLILRPAAIDFCLFPIERAPTQQIPCTAHCFDIPTGQETPLTWFNDRHSQEFLTRIAVTRSYTSDSPEEVETELVYDTDNASVSPDGRYMMWKAGDQLCVTPLNGGETIWTGYSAMILPLWYPDSKSWLGFTLWSIRRRFLDKSHETEITFVPGWVRSVPLGITEDNSLLLHRVDQMFRRKRYQLDEKENKRPVDVVLEKVKLGGKIRLARRFTIPLPAPGIVRYILVSPNGKKLAWLIWETAYDLMGTTYSLWTTGLEGQNRHLIGITEEQPCEESEREGEEDDSEDDPCPHHLQWSPDSRQLSFTYGNELFAVSVRD